MVHYFATAGPTSSGQDVQPLHHAYILMIYDVAMHDKASGGPRIKINPKRYRSERRIFIDVWLIGRRQRTSGLRCCARDNDGVMPLRRIEFYVIYPGDQKMILMDVKRMIGK